jgi:RNA polymerase sigma-70 factor (ECF subfamily)
MSMMEPESLARLLDKHGAALVLYARQWCAGPEDVVQEAIIKLVEQKPPPANAIAWLFRVVRNSAISAARTARRRRQHETAAAADAPSWFVPAGRDQLDAAMAAAALEALPLQQREIIIAHLWGGLTFEQIADVAGVPASTAHRWYVAGLTALRERLETPWPKKPRVPN